MKLRKNDPLSQEELLRTYRLKVARKRFTEQKRKEGLHDTAIFKVWWQLPMETKVGWATETIEEIDDLLNESIRGEKKEPSATIRYSGNPPSLQDYCLNMDKATEDISSSVAVLVDSGSSVE
jgi:hypothetical protein